jgi:serine/threonine protein kinase
MSRASTIVGECVDISAPQSDTAATETSFGICASAPVSGARLSAHRMQNHTCWFVLSYHYLLLVLTDTIILLDIKADNIMFGIADDSVFSDFEERELETPSPRKELNRRTIYVSRELRMPRKWGAPVLCDFGSAMPGGIEHFEDVQPNIYRAPEVILEAPWTYSVDIWNVGCMVRESV